MRPVPILLALLLILYTVNGLFYTCAQSITSDEGSFIHYAIRWLRGHPERIYPLRDNSKMPVSVINLIPRAVDQWLHPGLTKVDGGVSDILAGRYITLLVSLFTILLVFKWSKELYGEHAGLFSAFLVSFCPNMIASAGLVTTDSYSVLALLTTIYCLWKFCNNPSVKFFILFAVCIALSQLVKQSLFHLYIICPLAIGAWCIVQRPVIYWKPVAFSGVTFILINWLIINLGFYFHGTNTPTGNYRFISSTFQALQQRLPGWFPLPLPKDFVTGLDMAKYYDQIGGGISGISSFGKVTIMGNSSTGGSFWYYYFVSFLFKTPVAALIFFVWSLLLTIRRRSPETFQKNEFFLLLPVVYFLIYMSFLYNTQCGIRQIIFIYPFLYILSGCLFQYIRNIYVKSAVAVLSIYLIISVLWYWRNYYPYTNELIGDKKMAFRYVGASNLEFQQGNNFFLRYRRLHPGLRSVSIVPAVGTYLLNVNDYMDIWNLHRYDWIGSISPSAHVAYDGLLITVTNDDIKHLTQ